MYGRGDELPRTAREYEKESADAWRRGTGTGERRDGVPLSVLTFNLLAPCYKRLRGGQEGGVRSPIERALVPGWRLREADVREAWRARARDTCAFLCAGAAEPSCSSPARGEPRQPGAGRRERRAVANAHCEVGMADVLCLQEYFFRDESVRMFESSLGAHYECVYCRRPGAKEDGLATFVRRSRARVLDWRTVDFAMRGQRVALLVQLEVYSDGGAPPAAAAAAASASAPEAGAPSVRVLVLNTHLSFPHSALDNSTRLAQARAMTDFIDGYVERYALQGAPVLACGDYNTAGRDAVYAHFRAHGYLNCALNVEAAGEAAEQHSGDEASSSSSPSPSASSSLLFPSLPPAASNVVTHRTHRGELVNCDHVFVGSGGCGAPVSASVQRVRADLLPAHLDPTEWPGEQQYWISDHRPLRVQLRLRRASAVNVEAGADADRHHVHVEDASLRNRI